jgi:hypothetical protein
MTRTSETILSTLTYKFMRIQIKVVLEAKDDMDVEAMRPDYVLISNDWDSAMADIGRIQRKIEKVDHGDTAAQMDDDSDNEADPLVIDREN